MAGASTPYDSEPAILAAKDIGREEHDGAVVDGPAGGGVVGV